ncbi:MAG TPA: serine hydrolase [Phototrophicaceae bacterium]|nr:serine hydrolase [Phototrophicaceae bacterium]
MTLKEQIQAVIDETKIDAGVAVWQIESGEQFDINGSELFPMASVVKIPVLAAAGKLLAAGKLSFDQRVPLKDSDKSIGSGDLQFLAAGLNPTFRDLLTLMIIISDNTATDMCIDLIGGGAVVEQTMRDLGLDDIYVKMNVKELLRMLFPPEARNLPKDELEKWEETHDVDRDGVVFKRTSENNVSTPLAMSQLVYKLYQGEVVDNPTKDGLIDILLKQTLNARLPRFLPRGVRFAHKTGTIGGTRNDSGMMYISDTNHVIITAFTIWDAAAARNQPFVEQQRIYEVDSAIGKIGRLVYDHYSQ